MTYGLGKPRQERDYETPTDALAKAFQQWLDKEWTRKEDWEETYRQAVPIATSLPKTITSKQLNALITAHSNHENIQHAGWLLSALYNTIDEVVVSFDAELDRPMKVIGYRLPKNKTLISNATTQYLGYWASGIVINYATAQDLGWSASGILINYATVQQNLGLGASGTVINLGKAAVTWNMRQLTREKEEVLKKYLAGLQQATSATKELLTATKTEYERILAPLREYTPKNVKREIKEILRVA